MPADGFRHGEHVREVRRAVLLGRRADRDELEETVPDPGDGVGRELEPALLGIAPDELFESRFVDRDLALLQARNLGRVDVDAQHLVAGIGEAGARDEADVT